MGRLTIDELNKRLDSKAELANMTFRNIPNFYLSNDRDGAHVRMLISDASKTPVFHVHTVQLTSKTGKAFYADVDCIGNGCPFCREALNAKNNNTTSFIGYAKDKLFIPMYVVDKKAGNSVTDIGEVQIFTRPSSYYRNDLAPFNARNGSFENQGIEIERNGVKGDKNVSYRLYVSDKDYNGNPIDTKKSIDDIIGETGFDEDWIYGSPDSVIKTWTAEQMEEVIQTHKYPKTGFGNSQKAEATNTVEPKPRTRTANYGF